MVASEEYRQLAQRCVKLAIVSSAPSVAGALMALASDYLAQSHGSSEPSAAQRQMPLDTAAGFGD